MIEPSSTKIQPILIKPPLIVEAIEVHRLVEEEGTFYSLAVEQSRRRWVVDAGELRWGVEFGRKERGRSLVREIES